MGTALRLLIGLAVLASLLAGAGHSFGVSGGASFTAMNSTIGINQDLFFNVSADFPQQTSYSIFLGNVSIYNGTFPPNFAGYSVVKYNVTNLPSGTYPSYAKFSGISFPFDSNIQTLINPTSRFEFPGYSPVTPVFNGTASLDIQVLNDGNTPLSFTWYLPTVRGVTFSLTYNQRFSLEPSHTESIPIAITVSGQASQTLDFQFSASSQTGVLNKTYSTRLFTPVVNLSFYGSQLTPGIGNTTIYSVNIRNGDNAPVNVTFHFLLSIDNNDFYYNKSYMVNESTTAASVLIPKSTVEQVNAYFQSANGTTTNDVIYAAPAVGASSSFFSAILGSLDYILLAAVAITILLILHYRLSMAGRRRQ